MTKELIDNIVESSVESLDYVLLEHSLNHGKTKDVLKIVIYHPDKKITSDDCTTVANIISARMDINDPFERAYDLIVESPGLEREIKSPKEYPYFIGKEFKVFLNEAESEATKEGVESILTKEGFLIAILQNIEDNVLLFKLLNGSLIDVPLDNIKKAKLYCDYEKLFKEKKKNK